MVGKGNKTLNTDFILAGLDGEFDEMTVIEPVVSDPVDARTLDLPAERIMLGGRRKEPNKKRLMIVELDPSVCRRWHHHNRFEEWFDYEHCKDLIDDLLVNEQEMPGVVRKLEDDPEGYEYEVIFGGRRHFSVQYINDHYQANKPFRAIVRDVTDHEAARLMDLENRKRSDISDFERCVSFRRQVGKVPGVKPIFQGLADLYQTLEAGEEQGKVMTKAALSQMIAAGEFNEIEPLISLFQGRRHLIPWSLAYRLMKQWNGGADIQQQIRNRARELYSQSSALTPEQLIKKLLESAHYDATAEPSSRIEEHFKVGAKVVVKATLTASNLSLKIPMKALQKYQREDILDVLEQALDKMSNVTV